VLPSHGNVFRGLRTRTAQLRAHHAATLDRLRGLLAPGESTATELAARLFPGALDPFHGMLALGETLAHLRRLELLGAVDGTVRGAAAAGPRRYRLRAGP